MVEENGGYGGGREGVVVEEEEGEVEEEKSRVENMSLVNYDFISTLEGHTPVSF